MTNTKKVTKKENFAEIKDILAEMGRDDLVKVMEHELELLARKNAGNRKPTADQELNEKIKAVMLEVMDTPRTITEIMKLVQPNVPEKELTNQKISALARALKEDGKVVKTTDKRKSLFARA